MSDPPAPIRRGSIREVFLAFLVLGVTSFGGPVAHLGYFRAAFVERRRWLDERTYADLVALCQFLPGPASSQVGFAIGLLRAGFGGALAAFVAFTLPSAVLMVAFAAGANLVDGPVGDGLITGLQAVAVAVVAHAVWGMARALTPDPPRAVLAVGALAVVLLWQGVAGQVVAVAAAALAGLVLCRSVGGPSRSVRFPVRVRTGVIALTVLAIVVIGGAVLATATGSAAVMLFEAFARSGMLVFGGGHVVLPLLEASVVQPGWVSEPQFLAGYAAAQAVPGPLFTFAGFLGAVSTVGPGGLGGALIALVAIFLPGLLLLIGTLPFWNRIQSTRWAGAMLAGASAGVVGILAAALYDPVFTTGVTGPATFTLAAACFVALQTLRVPAWIVVLVGAVAGVALAFA